MTCDVIIVGQGISGSVLALAFIKAGYKVHVIDAPLLSSCSKVAAGIWNPVVFKRLTKSWLADDVVPELNTFYKYAEALLGVPLIHQRHILKSFTEEQEKNLWLKKAGTENRFLDPLVYHDLKLTESDILPDYSKVLQAGNLDVATFLEHTKNYLLAGNHLWEEPFDHAALEHAGTPISYKTLKASAIVFCEGHLVSKNPFFNDLPMKPAKGEVLTIQCEGLTLTQDILNKGIFILPLGNHLFKVGATYEWENLDDLPTEKARAELVKKLDSVIHVPYRIMKQEAGVRPAVIDRRPVIGAHRELRNYYIFNGFGTKAVMLAPYFSEKFIKHYQSSTEFEAEINPNRFLGSTN